MKSKVGLSLRMRLALAFSIAVALTLMFFGASVATLLEVQERHEDELHLQPHVGLDDNTERILIIMAIALPVAVAAAAFSGFFLAKRSLQPLVEASQRAQTARASELDLVLPLANNSPEWNVLATTLNTLLQDARNSMNRIRSFTGDAAHELRTPLTTILGEAELALRRQRPVEELEKSIATIQSEAQKLARLVDALLLLARADAGVLLSKDLSLVSIDELTDKALERARLFAEKNGKPIGEWKVVGSASPVPAEPSLLARALDNLLENAVRYGGADVTLTLSNNDQRSLISVHDNGPGIPDSVANDVFQRFVRGTESRTGDGFGLGLSITQAILEAHGGNLRRVASKEGATFSLELPR